MFHNHINLKRKGEQDQQERRAGSDRLRPKCPLQPTSQSPVLSVRRRGTGDAAIVISTEMMMENRLNKKDLF